MKNVNKDPLRVYTDDGSTGVKVVFYNENGDLIKKTVSNNAVLENSLSDDSATYFIEDDTFTFYLGSSNTLSTNNLQFQYSNHACASVHHALHSLNVSGDVDLFVTLPINQFYKGTKKNTENIEKKKNAMLRDVRTENDDSIKINSVTVWPEAIPALRPLLVDGAGNSIVSEHDYSLVCDIGGNSIDCVIFVGCAEVIMRAESFDLGMIECYPLISTALGKSVNIAHAKELLETGQCMNGKFTVDREEITRPLMSKAVNKINAFLGDDIDKDFLAHTVVIGGGADLLSSALNNAGFDSKVIEDPTMALVSAIADIDRRA